MNLHAIAGPIVSAVNPWVTASIQRSTGYTTDTDGTQVPSYAAAEDAQVQMQALQYKDLMQLSGLNINGEKRALYISGDWCAVLRPDGKGGDLVTMPDGSQWLAVLVLENWATTAGWTKVAVVKQVLPS